MKRQHADIIEAWLEGADVQYWSEIDQEWKDIQQPSWNPTSKYRVKPNAEEQQESEFILTDAEKTLIKALRATEIFKVLTTDQPNYITLDDSNKSKIIFATFAVKGDSEYKQIVKAIELIKEEQS